VTHILRGLEGRRAAELRAGGRFFWADVQAGEHTREELQHALEGMQMMGGYGYSSEYDMERLVRQTLVSTIYGGTSEIQRNIIAKTLGL
jgi:alkylation response protein AidB-like acyl-CoA dehydrogenase